MRPKFWHEKWEKNEIGFHQEDVNPHLQKFWNKLPLEKGQSVFVPLCGKSKDMLWLNSQGQNVIGVELSFYAVSAFFGENSLEAAFEHKELFKTMESENIKIFSGDFFSLQSSDLEGVAAVYDRAALVAFPSDMRKGYANHLLSTLPNEISMLLVSMEYPEGEMEGPPFSVDEKEIEELYKSRFQIEKLHEQNVLEEEQHFKEKGLTSLTEKVYLLKQK